MEIKNKFTGTGVALITPFNDDKTIDFASFEKLINYVIDNGVNYLLALGTTSEYVALTEEEQKEVVKFIVKINNNRLPILLGVGGNDTAKVIGKLKTTDFTGISAILSVAPYYNKPSQAGLYQHFEEIAKNSPLPIILYNVPGRTSVNILPETVLKLAELDNIFAIKEASGNVEQIMQIIKNKPNDFLVISGDDALTFPLILLGASGVISVAANAYPKQMSEMVNFAVNNEVAKAKEIHYSLLDNINLLFAEGNPSGIKATLEIMGMIKNNLRLPLVKVSELNYEKIKNILSYA